MQVAHDAVAEHKITKPEVGHLAKAGVKPMRHVEEFRPRGAGGRHHRRPEVERSGNVQGRRLRRYSRNVHR